MVSLEIQYRPFWLLWFKRTIRRSFPVQYTELSKKQFIAVNLLATGETGDISFLSAMTGFSRKMVQRLGKFQRYKLFEVFEGFGIEKPYNAFIIKSLPAGGKNFFPPNPKLAGMTFGQYIFAETLHNTWQASREKTDLARFVACIYLPPGKTFSENMVTENAALFAKTDIKTLNAVSTNWKLISKWLSEAYPLLFISDETSSAEVSPPVSGGGPRVLGGGGKGGNNTWIKIFDSVVGDDLVNSDRYSALPVNTVFRFLTARIKQNMKRKN